MRNVLRGDGLLVETAFEGVAQRRAAMRLEERVPPLDTVIQICGRRCVSSVRYARAAAPKPSKCWRWR